MNGSGKEEIMKRLKKYGMTRFQTSVLRATLDVPKGEVRTYGQIATMIRHPKAYRAVGTALSRNPLPIIVPCHRVIRSGGSLGNYSGKGGTRKKKLLLKKEMATDFVAKLKK